MKIKLVQSGGFLPVTKVAVADVDWSDDEWGNLISVIGENEKIDSPARDALYHTLEANGKEVPVNLSKTPEAFRGVIEDLRAKLIIVKF